jgi:membrane-associated protein
MIYALSPCVLIPKALGENTLSTEFANWLQLHAALAAPCIAFIAFAEACIGIGLFVSGIVLVSVGSLLFTNGLISLEALVPLALLGALLGDHTGFYVGRVYGPRLLAWSALARYQKSLNSCEDLLRRYGALAIFIGRFIPAIRSLLPALIGTSGFNRLHYSLFDLLACLLWSLALGAIIVGVDQVL